jgi:predicted dehydrogenase
MLRTLILGLGRAGWGLHLPVLARIHEAGLDREYLAAEPIVVYDPQGIQNGRPPVPLTVVDSLAAARQMLDPDNTVVHLCTPPSVRREVLEELAGLGFRMILVEKPLASDRETLDRIIDIRLRRKLDLMVMGHWLDSAVTTRLSDVIKSGELGELRKISAVQRKPRFGRSLMTDGHPSAFEVEVPHSLGVALFLAGDAEVTGASWSDMAVNGQVIPRMGSAHLRARHSSGVETEIFSVLTAMQRERQIALDFDDGHVTGYYPVGQDDDYASLSVIGPDGVESRTVFPDDSLTVFVRNAYRRFVDGEDLDPDFLLNVRVANLISDAKQLCAANGRGHPIDTKEAIGSAG